MIIKVDNVKDCEICDNFLTLLIEDERKYSKSTDEKFVVKDYFINMINKEHILLLAKEDGIPKGYVFARKWEKVYIIDGLYVDEKYRNQHIATKLLKEIIKYLKNNKIYIAVLKENKVAFNLYQSFGFVVIKEVNNKCLMILEKRLK